MTYFFCLLANDISKGHTPTVTQTTNNYCNLTHANVSENMLNPPVESR